MSINIRLWHQDDLEVVQYILWETWKESYSSFIPVDDLQSVLQRKLYIKKTYRTV